MESPIAKQPWHVGTAPQFIALFLWGAFFDRLGTLGLAVGGFSWSALGLILGALVCAGLFYGPLAWKGWKTEQDILGLAQSSLGTKGSHWIAGLSLLLAQLLVFAIATEYALDLTFRGLRDMGFLHSATPELWRQRWVYPISVVSWCIAFGLVGMTPVLTRMILAIMRYYPIFPALVLGGILAWALWISQSMDPSQSYLPNSRDSKPNDWLAVLSVLQSTTAFFALFAAFSVHWSQVNRNKRDIIMTGLVGVGIAPIVMGFIALTTLAILAKVGDSQLNYRQVALEPLNLWFSSIAAWILALASMAIAAFSANNWTVACHQLWPGRSSSFWIGILTAATFPLILLGSCDQPEILWSIVGALIAPLLGIIFAKKSSNPTSNPKWRITGIVAWCSGTFIGLAGTAIAHTQDRLWIPSTLASFLVGFLIVKIKRNHE